MKQIALIIAVTLRLAACGNEEPKRVQIRPVRVTSVQHALSGDTISLKIQAKDPINLAFRVGGRLQERSVTVARIPTNHYRVVGDFEDHRAQR
jgi:hypothetical protein